MTIAMSVPVAGTCAVSVLLNPTRRKAHKLMTFTEEDRVFLDRPAFATLATTLRDGTPQLTVMWYRRDEDTLRMIAPASATKVRNLTRNPRVAVSVTDPDNAYSYL